jgi:hypothetical protein
MFNSKRGNIIFVLSAILFGIGITWCLERCSAPYEALKSECIKLCGHERLVEDHFSEHECVCFTDREVVPR